MMRNSTEGEKKSSSTLDKPITVSDSERFIFFELTSVRVLRIRGADICWLPEMSGSTNLKFSLSFINGLTLGSKGFSTGEVYSTSIAIDSSGTPYVVYGDEGNENKATVASNTFLVC